VINDCERNKMPKFFTKFPFWIWSLLGLICLALAVPGFLASGEKKERQAALLNPTPPLVDLADFESGADIGLGGEVNVFAQTSPEYQFRVDGTGVTSGTAIVVPLFSAYAAPTEKAVQHVILADDLAEYEAWLEKNVAGTARMGGLYEINGEVVDGKGFTAAIRVTLRDAGLDQIDPLVIVKPFVAGREAGLGVTPRRSFGNPYILAGSGIWMIWFGFVVWSRVKKHSKSVSRRMGEIGERTVDEETANLSRLKRTSQKLAKGKLTVVEGAKDQPVDPSATPAE